MEIRAYPVSNYTPTFSFITFEGISTAYGPKSMAAHKLGWSTLGCAILCTVLPNNFFGICHNFFPLFRSKAMQKTKNWKILWIFSPGTSPLKFYYITQLCEMELPRKFEVFRSFHYKTIIFSSESEFSMKNVFFWGIAQKLRKLKGGS